MALRDYIRQRPPVASRLEADIVIPDPDVAILQSDHVATMDAWGLPDDLPVPISEDNGIFVPATATDSNVGDWDPWIWADVAKMTDRSRPAVGPYLEPSSPGKAGSIVAEWGGMPLPVRAFQDVSHKVLYSPRQVNYHESKGVTGQFHGPQQNVYEQTATLPAPDYWSTIILQGAK